MTSKHTIDGWVALPHPVSHSAEEGVNHGQLVMSLRDWFAGQALAGIIERDTKHGEEELFRDCPEESMRSENGDLEMSPRVHVSTDADSYEVVAQAAYAIADAMLAARKEVQS